MTLYQFKLLDLNTQAEILWEKGVLLADRADDKNKFLLYQLDGFYVEVMYNPESNCIEAFKSFISTNEPLMPYLQVIKIDGIN